MPIYLTASPSQVTRTVTGPTVAPGNTFVRPVVHLHGRNSSRPSIIEGDREDMVALHAALVEALHSDHIVAEIPGEFWWYPDTPDIDAALYHGMTASDAFACRKYASDHPDEAPANPRDPA